MLLDHLPVDGEIVYAPSFHVRGYTKITGGANAEHDKQLFEKGLLFPTTDEAIAETGRIYEILEEEKKRVMESHERAIVEQIRIVEGIEENKEESADSESEVLAEESEDERSDSYISPESIVTPEEMEFLFGNQNPFEGRPEPSQEEIDALTQAEINKSVSDDGDVEESPLAEQYTVPRRRRRRRTKEAVAEDEPSQPIEDPERVAAAYMDCAKLFDIGDEDVVVRRTPYSAALRVAGGILVDRVERAREDFIMFTSRKMETGQSAEVFADLVRNIPKEARAQILSIMGPRKFAEMMASFYNSAREMGVNE